LFGHDQTTFLRDNFPENGYLGLIGSKFRFYIVARLLKLNFAAKIGQNRGVFKDP
jgi:hypothetical protein